MCEILELKIHVTRLTQTKPLVLYIILSGDIRLVNTIFEKANTVRRS